MKKRISKTNNTTPKATDYPPSLKLPDPFPHSPLFKNKKQKKISKPCIKKGDQKGKRT